jgi:Flp pilus assembly protein TadD
VSNNEKRELEKTLELTDKGRFDEAIARLEVLQTSADTEVHDLAVNFLADAYAASGRPADAESMLRRSMNERADPNDGLGSQLVALAAMVRRQGRNDEAEELYLRAIDVQRGDDPAITVITMRNLAYLYWVTGRQDKVRETIAHLPECDEQFLADLSGTMTPYLEPEIPA